MIAVLLLAQSIAAAPPSVVPPKPPENGSTAPPGTGAASPVIDPAARSSGATKGAVKGNGVETFPASFFAAAQPATAYDMIGRLPGFAFDDGGGVRGYGGAGGNVLIDGERPASKSDDLVSVLARIPASQVDHVDLIRGAAPGIDMQGKAVLANVVRRREAVTTLVATSTQQLLTGPVDYFPSAKIEWSHTTAADRSYGGSIGAVKGFDDTSGGGARRTVAADGRETVASDDYFGQGRDFTVTGNYAQPLWGGRLRVTGSGDYVAARYREDVIPADRAGADRERDRQRTGVGELGANFTKSLGGNLASETVLLQQVTRDYFVGRFTRTTGGERSDQLFTQRHVQTESIVREQLTWRRGARLTIEGGAEADYNRLASRTDFLDDGVAQELPAADVTVGEWRGEAFGKATITLSPKIAIEAGVRVEASRISSTGDVDLAKTLFYAKPKAALTWSIDDADQFRFRLEREVGQLDFADFVAGSSFSTGQIRAGNPDLRPQQAYVVEGAYERHFLKTGAAVLTLRRSYLRDVVDRAPIVSEDGAFDAPANIGSGTRDEALLTASAPLALPLLRQGLLKANGIWRHSAVTDPTTGDRRPISGLSPFRGSVTLNEDLPRAHLSIAATVQAATARTFYYFNQVERDEARMSGSLLVTYKPAPKLTMTLQLYEIGTGSDRRVRSWNGTRSTGEPASTQVRSLSIGPAVYLRVRREL